MDSLAACLKESIIFNSLDTQDFDELIPLFSQWRICPGEVLAQAGQTAQYYFLLEKGTVLLAMEEGRAVVLNSPGDFAGFSLMSRAGQGITTVTVLEEGWVWAVPREAFLDQVQQDTPAAELVMAGWQQYLEEKAAFVHNSAEINVPVIY